MKEPPFQAYIVGRDTLPSPYRTWSFLKDFMPKLKDGQAIRLVIPKGQNVIPAINYWGRAISKYNGKKSHSRRRKQSDGSTILYLWFSSEYQKEEEKYEIQRLLKSFDRSR